MGLRAKLYFEDTLIKTIYIDHSHPSEYISIYKTEDIDIRELTEESTIPSPVSAYQLLFKCYRQTDRDTYSYKYANNIPVSRVPDGALYLGRLEEATEKVNLNNLKDKMKCTVNLKNLLLNYYNN